MPVQPGWAEQIVGWHDFFLMSGTAAVTLAGLLFVAISLHVDALVHSGRQHLIDLARATLLTFVMVLTTSLMMLAPLQSQRIVGFQLLVLGTLFVAFTLRLLFSSPGTAHADFSLRLFRQRLILPLVGYAWIGLTGLGLMRGGSPRNLMFLIGGICTLLGNALGASWDLLVRVARLKHTEAQKQGH